MEKIGATPETYNGHLRHASTIDVEFGDHALNVLAVLLERLDRHGNLPDTQVTCALVKPPTNPIKLGCFDHENAVELLQALDDLRRVIATDNVPTAPNLSLGLHVGPHNGDSPLEEAVRNLAPVVQDRVWHVAAGNEGMTGVSGRRVLSASEPDCLKVRTGPNAKSDLLMQFWWREPWQGALTLKDEAFSATGASLMSFPIEIGPGTAGSVLATCYPSIPGIIGQSLFQARCYKDICVSHSP